jgi:hypothetical protein
MREAFARALAQAAAEDRVPQLEPATLAVLRTEAGADRAETPDLPASEMAKALYAARVLGGRWRMVVHGMGRDERLRGQLRTDWIVLHRCLHLASPRQRIQLLAAAVESMDVGSATTHVGTTAYLREQQQRHELRVAAPAQIPGVAPLSPAGVFLDTIEDLLGAPEDERDALHALLRQQAPPQPTSDLTWLLEALSAWLTTRQTSQDAD